MNSSQLIPILVAAATVYFLYERTNDNTKILSDEHRVVAEKLKVDITDLIDIYYQRYLYPHEYPSYKLVIPATRSEYRSDDRSINVVINDPITGEIFYPNSIRQIAAHEAAHMLCRIKEENDHGPLFVDTLQKLNAIGEELGMYDSTLEIDRRYKYD